MLYHLQAYQDGWCVQFVKKGSLVEAHGGSYRRACLTLTHTDPVLPEEESEEAPHPQPIRSEGARKKLAPLDDDLF